MSKIRTLGHLQDAMDAESVWRKKELASLKTMVLASKNTSRQDLSVRAAVTLLYAHWEGFIKKISDCYMEFVARQELKNKEIGPSFLATTVGQLMKAVVGTNKVQPWIEVVALFRTKADSKCDMKWKGVIKTRANLNSAVFREIVTALGLDYRPFETKANLLDRKLLENRNHIAHGRDTLVDFEEYMTLHGQILGIMQQFSDQVANAAIMKTYRVSP